MGLGLPLHDPQVRHNIDMERLLRNNKASWEAAAHTLHVLEVKEHGAEKD